MAPKRSLSSDSLESGGSPSLAAVAKDWPASSAALQSARSFLRECALKSSCTLLVPDKDADGLTGTLIIYRTLVALGHPEHALKLHFINKGSNPHENSERQKLAAHRAEYAIVVDQGSRSGPALVLGAKTLLVDHHLSDDFPADTLVLSACKHEPVATSATLAYVLCRPLHSSIVTSCDYLCAMGTLGDLGTSFQFAPPFPQDDMNACFKKYTKKAVTDAVSLVNAPRRTATYDVESAWKALHASSGPSDIVNPPRTSPALLANTTRLREARAEVNAEVERCTHTPPAFSGDGKVALLRIASEAQVHPVIATRWAGHLRSARLQVVMVANTGYTPGRTHFSCRVARTARAPSAVDIIALLKDYAARVPGLADEMGDDFARGHRQASGGIVATAQFERLWEAMVVSVPDDGQGAESPRKKRKTEEVQKNTLEGWVKRS